ncbi:hypothetical protein C2G38_2138235 [Gigaspora rosea]|uniref:Uncharacterized protein n=1 Tax=Gigaspora rosea TaxID=44941 RepID=A0A397VXS8_9GLOM|nr:hypothetical protein C2G38_2138235 [Gigaspora rosea]
MGIYRSNKRRYQAREAAKKSLEKRYHNKVLEQVTSQLAVIYQEQLVAVHQILSELPNNGSVTNEEIERSADQESSNNIIKKRNHLIALITKLTQISELHITTQISQIAQASAFGVMVDESTRGELKNLIICYQAWNKHKQFPTLTMVHLKNIFKCNSETISNAIIESIQKEGLDIKKCILWTTDICHQTKMVQLLSLTKKLVQIHFELTVYFILCRLYFEQDAFGNLPTTAEFSRIPHSYNLLYLAWSLHNEYNPSSRDKPLNITAEIIKIYIINS